MTVSRRKLLAFTLPLALAAGTASAQDAGAPQTVTQFYAVLLQIMKAGRSAPFQQRYQTLAPAVDQAFDLPGILRVSVGSYWASIPPAQQQTLLSVFRAYTIANYVSNFHSYKGRVISVSPNTRAVGTEQVVMTTITKPSRDPLRIDYVLRGESAGWKIVDVLLDGTISRVAVQRSDFASLVSSGNASQLITNLKSKVSSLSDGAISV
ncbi:MAG TPA: ABC transporter substrate-binding protein [Acidisoma sp.]|jgi:phospholipid transport system substrate-binding protein|nr:ABC transporter substrate-binding protein [Acidisoma sp.]